MQILILIAIILTVSLRDVPGPEGSPREIALAVPLYVLVAAALAGLHARVTLRRLRRSDDSRAVLRRHHRQGAMVQAYLLTGFAALLLAGFERWISTDPALSALPLAAEMVLLSPFVAAMLIYWLLEYPVHRAVRERQAANGVLAAAPPRFWTLREYLDYNLRHQFLFIALPVGLILFLGDLLRMYGWPMLERGGLLPAAGSLRDVIEVSAATAVALGVFAAAPLLVVRVWRTEPLPPGSLRAELLDVLKRLRLGCRDLLVWKSGGVIANAAVLGLLPRLRYVLLTDVLLERMDERPLRAIFAHEVGHLASHHVFYSALFAVSSVLLAGAAGDALVFCGADLYVGQGAAVALLAAAWGLGFGYISRRFERQSDVIGAWMAGQEGEPGATDPDRISPQGAALFAQALEQVAGLNGVGLDQRNWRHGTIRWRVDYILGLGVSGGTRREIDRTVGRIKRSLWAMLIAAVAATAADFYFFT